jgi:DNA-binding LacI/PurR family transcriptional regulator
MTGRRSGRANSTEVARLAGVSIAAVSRAFTPGSSITPQLAEKVFAAARELNYVPNTLARSIITRETKIVAVMIPRDANPRYADLLAEITARVEGVGKQVLLFSPESSDDFDRTLQHMLQFQVDAIVIAAATISSRMAELCLGRNVPVVVIVRHVPGLPVHSVRGDAHQGGRLAADIMLSGGAKRLAIITGPPDLTTMLQRSQAIMDRTSATLGADAVTMVEGGMSYEGGRSATLALVRDWKPDSIICLTDVMALGAMDAVRHDLKLRVPEDVAIMGFDDIPASAYASYDLTTIRTPVTEIVDHLMDLIKPAALLSDPVSIEIPAEVVIRSSTRIPSAAV